MKREKKNKLLWMIVDIMLQYCTFVSKLTMQQREFLILAMLQYYCLILQCHCFLPWNTTHAPQDNIQGYGPQIQDLKVWLKFV